MKKIKLSFIQTPTNQYTPENHLMYLIHVHNTDFEFNVVDERTIREINDIRKQINILITNYKLDYMNVSLKQYIYNHSLTGEIIII